MNKRRLTLVAEEDRLRGKAPQRFERLSRTAVVGTSEHRGVVHIVATLAGRCARLSVPPSAQLELLEGIAATELWIHGRASERQVRDARARCFQAVSGIEKLTIHAVKRANEHLSSVGKTELDHHADHVVERYARLAAHFSTSAVCHVLDAIADPKVAPEVLQDIEGARAYQATGLGAARHPAFRKAAWDQAAWEASRPGQVSNPEQGASLALQVFHEYLGGRWRNHADAERFEHARFIDWALGGQPLQ